ncbi:MAG: hypothetical protein ACREIV_13630, partial [Planctomycetaceae bacterium]
AVRLVHVICRNERTNRRVLLIGCIAWLLTWSGVTLTLLLSASPQAAELANRSHRVATQSDASNNGVPSNRTMSNRMNNGLE